jgi:hypothetical protein
MKRGYAAQFGERFTRLRRAKITTLVPRTESGIYDKEDFRYASTT